MTRCNYQNIQISDIENILFNRSGAKASIQDLSKAGFWNLEEKYFTSTLLLNYYYNSPLSTDPSDLQQFQFPAEIVNDPLVQRIYAGFCIFKEIDFMGAAPDARVSVENAISARWATYLHAHMPTVFISSQVRTISEVVKPGATPTVDFLLNGRGQFAVEFSLNGYNLKKKVFKFEDGYYKEWKSKYAIVNIITNSKDIEFGRNTKPNSIEHQDMIEIGTSIENIYQFVTQTNKLYKGTTLLLSNVSSNLPSPP